MLFLLIFGKSIFCRYSFSCAEYLLSAMDVFFYFFFISASKRRSASALSLHEHGPVMQPPGHDITSTILPGHLPVFA